MSFLQTALTPSCAPARTIEKCTVEDAVDADFIILPMANYNAGDLETIVQTLERDHNATLFRRGMKDHIIPGLQNTRKSYQMAKELSTRSHELANPMVKFVVDIWCVVRSSGLSYFIRGLLKNCMHDLGGGGITFHRITVIRRKNKFLCTTIESCQWCGQWLFCHAQVSNRN